MFVMIVPPTGVQRRSALRACGAAFGVGDAPLIAANTGTNTTNAASALLTEDRNVIEISSQSRNDRVEIPVTPNDAIRSLEFAGTLQQQQKRVNAPEFNRLSTANAL